MRSCAIGPRLCHPTPASEKDYVFAICNVAQRISCINNDAARPGNHRIVYRAVIGRYTHDVIAPK